MKEEIIRQLYKLVEGHNKRVNVTAISGYDDFLLKHINDSELGEKYIEGKKILDIGSGAGFPGLVFAVNDKSRDVTLVDSVGKKVNVINDIIEKMEIKNAIAVHSRIEDFGGKEGYDCVTARAVAPLNILAEYALPFVKKGGLFIAYKSANTEEEINAAKQAIKLLGGIIEKTADEQLSPDTLRRFVIIRKIKSCDKQYPRPRNLPRLKPL